MLAYKYRNGSTKKLEGENTSTFERDLSSLEKNYFWAPSFENLNDPYETSTVYEKVTNQLETFGKLFNNPEILKSLLNVKEAGKKVFGVREKSAGLYSMSRTYLDELLWAHYGNSHSGFCIEYDLDLIENKYRNYKLDLLEVQYTEEPPQIELSDFNRKYEETIRKIAGHKSRRWEYEKEIRLVTAVYGIYPYPPECLKSIYFGLRLHDRERQIIMKRLKGRGVKYYEIVQIPNSYNFQRKEISDPNGTEITYLQQIQDTNTNTIYRFKIVKQDYHRVFKKGTITVELEKRVPLNVLNKLGKLIKTSLFDFAERIFMLYRLEEQMDIDQAWATSHFENGKINPVINKFFN